MPGTVRRRTWSTSRTLKPVAVPNSSSYARRKAIVEPVFGQINTRQGKHVLLRGLKKASAEWKLMAGCHNLLKLFSHRTATT